MSGYVAKLADEVAMVVSRPHPLVSKAFQGTVVGEAVLKKCLTASPEEPGSIGRVGQTGTPALTPHASSTGWVIGRESEGRPEHLDPGCGGGGGYFCFRGSYDCRRRRSRWWRWLWWARRDWWS